MGGFKSLNPYNNFQGSRSESLNRAVRMTMTMTTRRNREEQEQEGGGSGRKWEGGNRREEKETLGEGESHLRARMITMVECWGQKGMVGEG